MQQLDLFGAIIETKSTEKNKAEETVVPLVKNIDADETEVFVPIIEAFLTFDAAVVDENNPREDIHKDEQNDGDDVIVFSSREEGIEKNHVLCFFCFCFGLPIMFCFCCCVLLLFINFVLDKFVGFFVQWVLTEPKT